MAETKGFSEVPCEMRGGANGENCMIEEAGNREPGTLHHSNEEDEGRMSVNNEDADKKSWTMCSAGHRRRNRVKSGNVRDGADANFDDEQFLTDSHPQLQKSSTSSKNLSHVACSIAIGMPTRIISARCLHLLRKTIYLTPIRVQYGRSMTNGIHDQAPMVRSKSDSVLVGIQVEGRTKKIMEHWQLQRRRVTLRPGPGTHNLIPCLGTARMAISHARFVVFVVAMCGV